jgi:hypothetical protein
METHTFPIAEQEKSKLDRMQSELRAQPALKRAQDFFKTNSSWVWTGIALTSLVTGCIAARIFGRR